MTCLCDLSHSKVEDLIQKSGNPEWKIGLDFLNGQRKTTQIGSMEGVDKILANKERKKELRNKKLQVRKEKEQERKKIASQLNSVEFSSDSEGELCDSQLDSTLEEEELVRALSRTSSRSSSVNLEIPTKDLISKTSSVADRYGVSRRVHLVLASAFIKAGKNIHYYLTTGPKN